MSKLKTLEERIHSRAAWLAEKEMNLFVSNNKLSWSALIELAVYQRAYNRERERLMDSVMTIVEELQLPGGEE